MSRVNNGVVTGAVRCVNAIAAVGVLLKAAFERQALYLQGTEELRAEMEAMQAQLAHCLIRPQRSQLLHTHVQALATARTVPAFREAATHMSAALHAEQEAIALEIAPLVAQATQLSNFQQVQQLQSPGRILIVGQDSHGKALQTELLTSPGKPLAIRSETLGFNDDTCTATLDQFQEHLEERGVTINTTRRTRTLRQRLRARLGVRQ